MRFDWSAYLGFAQNLLGEPPTRNHGEDALFRTVVSRAYYAAHGTARERLEHDGYKLPAEKVHEFVIEKFKESKDMNRVEIGANLDELVKKRVKADYKPFAIIQIRTARFATMLADKTITLIQGL